jgi:hypothetical protein
VPNVVTMKSLKEKRPAKKEKAASLASSMGTSINKWLAESADRRGWYTLRLSMPGRCGRSHFWVRIGSRVRPPTGPGS